MKGNRATNQYPLSVWIFSILLTPILMIGILGFTEKVNLVEQFELIPVFWVMGALLSSPSLLLFILSNRYIERFRIAKIYKKLIFSMIGVSCITITFYILGGWLALILAIFYSLVFLVLSLYISRHVEKQD